MKPRYEIRFFEVQYPMTVQSVEETAVSKKLYYDATRQIPDSTRYKILEIIRQTRDAVKYFDEVGIYEDFSLGIKAFIQDVEDSIDEVCIAHGKPTKRKNQKSFKRKNLANIFCDHLEPVLSQSTASSYMQLILAKAGLWPLRDGLLKPESLGDKLITFKNAITVYDQILSFEDSKAQGLNLKITLESLQLLWEVLSIANNAKNFKPLQKQSSQLGLYWCKCCFRRRDKSLMYCRIHSSQDDTEQGRAERIRKRLPSDAQKMFRRYETMRKLLGNNPFFLEANDGIGEADNQNAYLIDNQEEFHFFRQTLTEEWLISKNTWIDAIESQLPCVTAVIAHTHYKEADSWPRFVAALFQGLQEKHEAVNHPFWVKQILEIAENWLFYEERYGDGRKTETKQQIQELHGQGKSVNEIKVIVGKSKAYIYRIIKEIPLSH
jgi:hypothetical protein